MRRRQFITLAGSAIAAPMLSCFAARAQQAERPLVGVIFSGSANSFADRISAFRKGLAEMGYVDTGTSRSEYHGLEGQYELSPALLDDLIRRRVAVIATPGSNPVALAAKAATATIPIVFGAGWKIRWPWDWLRVPLIRAGMRQGSIFSLTRSVPKRLGRHA